MPKKLFTLEEANSLLPILNKELESLRELKQEFESKYYELHNIKDFHKNRGPTEQDPYFRMECEMEFLQIEVKMHSQYIFDTGAELKDIEHGLVDFPAMVDGREVLLCWKYGEERISHYHERSEGFQFRKPLKSVDME